MAIATAPISPELTFNPTAALGALVAAVLVVCPATVPCTRVLVCTTVLPAGFVVVRVARVVPVGLKLELPVEAAVLALAVLNVVVVKEQLRSRSLTS